MSTDRFNIEMSGPSATATFQENPGVSGLGLGLTITGFISMKSCPLFYNLDMEENPRRKVVRAVIEDQRVT